MKVTTMFFILTAVLASRSNEIAPCLVQSEAEKILGQPASLTESSVEEKEGIVQMRCTYTSNMRESGTDRYSHLYYVLERYDNPDAARRVYEEIIRSNSGMSGHRTVNGIGEEAWLHTDSENFVLLISRSKNHLVRIKVNKLTGLTSLEELQKVTRDLVGRL